MAAVLAVALPSLVQRHVLDVAVLAIAAALVVVRPRLAPYIAIVAVLLPSSATHLMSSDGLALAGVAAGLVIHRVWRRDRELGPALTGPLVALAALDALLLLSLLGNAGSPQESVAAQSTGYFISRTVLIVLVVVLASPRLARQLDWLCAAALGGSVLAVTRALELAGVPVQTLANRLSVQVLGSTFSTTNVYALVLAVCAFLALAAAEQLESRRLSLAMRGVAVVLLAAAGTGTSRTAVVAILLVLVGLAALADRWQRRVQYAVLTLGFAAASLLPTASILEKPVVVSTHATTARVPTAAVPITANRPSSGPAAPVFNPPRGLSTTWRVLLDRPTYQFDQTFTAPRLTAHGNYVVLLARAAGRATDIRLRIAVNGVVAQEPTAAQVGTSYRWVTVPVPDAALAGAKNVVVSVSATGPLDSTTKYFALGGLDDTAAGVSPQAYSSGRRVEGDLSPDPGIQQGMALVFVDGRVPALTPLPPAGVQTLDESISDRLTLWRTAWHVFLQHPLVGTGFNTFAAVQAQDPQSALFASYGNAHDNLLSVLSDLGVLGPVLLLLVQAAALLALLGWPPAVFGSDRLWRVTFAGAIVVMLVMGLTQTWLADGRSAMLSWIVLLVAGQAGATGVHARFERIRAAVESRRRRRPAAAPLAGESS
jgi:hypothetical protein